VIWRTLTLALAAALLTVLASVGTAQEDGREPWPSAVRSVRIEMRDGQRLASDASRLELPVLSAR